MFKARQRRDASLRETLAELPGTIPQPLPKNVTSIPQQVLSSTDFQITALQPEQLVKSLADGSLSSVSVTLAFLRRAALAQQLVSTLADTASRCSCD